MIVTRSERCRRTNKNSTITSLSSCMTPSSVTLLLLLLVPSGETFTTITPISTITSLHQQTFHHPRSMTPPHTLLHSSSTSSFPSSSSSSSSATPNDRRSLLRQRWSPTTPSLRNRQSSSPNNNNNKSSQNKKKQQKKLKKPLPIRGYDATSICRSYDRRPFTVGYRLNSLGFPLLGWYFRLLYDEFLGVGKREDVQRRRGRELREVLVKSGSVALIKSGQALSLRPDVIRNKIWAEELGKLVDAVGSFSDTMAMDIIRNELEDVLPRIKEVDNKMTRKKKGGGEKIRRRGQSWGGYGGGGSSERLRYKVENDPILRLFEFTNDNRAVASASIGQVYKARLRRGPLLEAAIGKREAKRWGGTYVAVKVQRPDVAAAASLDMYLIRRAAMWLSKFRGGDLVSIADQFGIQLFGELDYIREADNCERFREMYGDWDDVVVPQACLGLTRGRVLVMEWVEGEKGPWRRDGIEMVRIGLRCSVDQLLNTGLFHADPHRGNLLRTPEGKLAFIDFGMMADVAEDERYGLIGLVIGLQNKDLSLISENLLKLGFLKDTTQLDLLVPRLRQALVQSTGGTGKASDVNFAMLQAQLDEISREAILEFRSPPFFTIIIRSLTILEGLALSVDGKFRLIRGAYPYVLKRLLSSGGEGGGGTTPKALSQLLVRLLTVDGKGKRIEWERLLDFLRLAQKATKSYDPSRDDITDDKTRISRQTIDLFIRFLTSKTGLFLKKPLVHELAHGIDGMASTGELNLLRLSRGLIRPLPGGAGPIDDNRMRDIFGLIDVITSAIDTRGSSNTTPNPTDNNIILSPQQYDERIQMLKEALRELMAIASDKKRREEALPILAEVSNVAQMVAVEILEIRGSRAMRSALRL